MLIRIGENAVVLQVSYDKTADCVAKIQDMYRILKERAHPDILSLRPGLDCLAVEHREGFDPTGLLLEARMHGALAPDEHTATDIFAVPVCYEEPFSRDLTLVADACGLTTQDVVDLHTSVTYDVWMLGFMPGFPYLGELPESLQLPRKPKPDPLIPAGSVAVAEEYCGVYPFDSPGGWHILGRTPLQLIDYTRTTPWIFDYGMRVKFHPITMEQFRQLSTKGLS
jgi:KipI family sensor histidine kinase inhibitor